MFGKIKNLFKGDKDKDKGKGAAASSAAAGHSSTKSAAKRQCVGEMHTDTAFKCTSEKCTEQICKNCAKIAKIDGQEQYVCVNCFLSF